MDICVWIGCHQLGGKKHFHLAHKGSVTVIVNRKQEITEFLFTATVPR